MSIVTNLRGDDRDERMRLAYPSIVPPCRPCGTLVLVQLKRPNATFRMGLIKAEDTRDLQRWEAQIGLVKSLGPLAYRDETGEVWETGQWCAPGDYVRVPKHGLDKFFVTPEGGKAGDRVIFAFVRDRDIRGVWTGDPLWEEDDYTTNFTG